MKLVSWIITLCNRKWKKQLDTLIVESEAEEPLPIDNDIFLMRDSIEQPTHLSRKFQARAKRKKHYSKPKPSTKEKAYQETINVELKRMAQGR